MLAEIKRFHAAATRLLQTDTDETVGEFVERHGFSRYFVDHFMTPLVAAVWSCPPGEAMRYPARYLFVFLGHHGMLSVFGSPRWRTIVGGSANYVEAILTRIDEVHAGDPVTSVRRVADGVEVTGGATRVFDAAAIATHPDQALLMLAEPTAVERAVLGAIPYCTNHAQLHTDESVLPRHRRARASWNYLVTPNDDSVLVTYDVTRLMRLVAAAPRAVAQAFADEVRAVRETMAVVSAATAVEPPEALRDRLLTDVSTAPVVELRRKPWRTTILAAVAALVIGLGALGVGLALRPAPAPSTAEQVFAASDVRTVSGQILTGGTATVVFSREKNAGVLVMNNVAPPAPGTVYQMWLIGDKGPESAGTMDAKAVGPSTTAVLPDLGSSKALAFTVEPPGGSAQPTSPVFAQLPLA
ncbi:MAG: putative NAD/FAD-binding protein [Mycobacterium sp.]|jgi:anti-sigma-K factor RskA|nr:putative NAD/FAD-binding protein [Mycobacterium sp.]